MQAPLTSALLTVRFRMDGKAALPITKPNSPTQKVSGRLTVRFEIVCPSPSNRPTKASEDLATSLFSGSSLAMLNVPIGSQLPYDDRSMSEIRMKDLSR